MDSVPATEQIPPMPSISPYQQVNDFFATRQSQQSNETPNNANFATRDPPPPYEEQSDDEDEDQISDQFTISINSSTTVYGTGNVVANKTTTPSTNSTLPLSPNNRLADATRSAATLIAAIKRCDAVFDANNRRRRALNINLTINCGVNIVGHRNLLGNTNLKLNKSDSVAGTEKSTAQTDRLTTDGKPVIGAKRKLEEDNLLCEDRETKRISIH